MEPEAKPPKLHAVASIIPRLRRCAQHLANDAAWHEVRVDSFSLFLQLGLHLPRYEWEFASRDEVIDAEGRRLRDRLATIRRETSNLVPGNGTDVPQLADLTFEPISDEVAKPILECYHYLMSFRLGSIHFGLRLRDEIWPFVLASLSPFDLNNVIQDDRGWTTSALVLSRVYAFRGTPRNAISASLSKVRNWLTIHRPDVSALVTYCNPNLGFTGASYEADNWQLLGYEHNTRYTYIDGNYATDRRVAELYGASPDTLTREPTGSDISFSVWPLMPLRLYVRGLHRSIGRLESGPSHFERWVPPENEIPPLFSKSEDSTLLKAPT